MSAEFQISDNNLTVFLSGDIDHHSIRAIREQIDEAVMDNSPDTLILDFGHVTFMDSSGIGLVIGRFKCISETNGRLIVQNPSSHIKKVMKLAGIDKLAEITNNNME